MQRQDLTRLDQKAAREHWSIRPLPKGDRKVITIA